MLVCQSVTDAVAPRQLVLDHRLDAVQAAPKRKSEFKKANILAASLETPEK